MFRNKSLFTCLTKFLHTNVVINKKENLEIIRHKIRDSLIADTQLNSRDEYYIGLVHTYPAWSSYLKNLFPFSLANMKSHVAVNPYGHTLAEFFKIEDGVLVYDKVMNVGVFGAHNNQKLDRYRFINWIDSHEYYFDSKDEITDKDLNLNLKLKLKGEIGNHQYGMLNRSFISINIKVNKYEWDKIHDYYYDVKYESEVCKTKKFSMVGFIFLNKLRNIFSLNEMGNCTYWTTRGFQEIGMLNTDSNFPMVSFYKLMISMILRKSSYFKDKYTNFNITLYKGVNHESHPKGSLLYPLYWVRHTYVGIWKTENVAHNIVELVKSDEHNHVYDKINIEKNSKHYIYDKIMHNVMYLNKVFYGN